MHHLSSERDHSSATIRTGFWISVFRLCYDTCHIRLISIYFTRTPVKYFCLFILPERVAWQPLSMCLRFLSLRVRRKENRINTTINTKMNCVDTFKRKFCRVVHRHGRSLTTKHVNAKGGIRYHRILFWIITRLLQHVF